MKPNRLLPFNSTRNALFCTCGASANSPFCDGSHKEVSFNIALELDTPKTVEVMGSLRS